MPKGVHNGHVRGGVEIPKGSVDNRIENLEVLTRAEHNRRHAAGRKRDARGRLLPRDSQPAGVPL